ncbi:WEB family protein At5g55860-like [Aristolochia californica]|uniref:WEB family protein At5g55860-like n=1 Tax=Aristolochia californica TaxID=171875 RepID=UPI0035D85302
MGVKTHQNSTDSPRKNSTDSPRREVGEIDTRAPFQSVKAACSLFGEGASVSQKPFLKKSKASSSNEKVFVKETELHLTFKELNAFKEQLKNAEITRTQALAELEKAKGTVEELTQKLKTVTKAKESALKATEAAKNEEEQLEDRNSGDEKVDGSWKDELDNVREQYTAAISELDVAKQELRQIRQDFDASISVKVSAYKQAECAELAAAANVDKTSELSKDIALVQDSLAHVKLACLQAQQEQARILSEKDVQKKSSKLALEEIHKKLDSLKKEFDPEMARILEEKLAKTTGEVGVLEQELEKVKLSDLESVNTVTAELDDAKGTLQKVAEKESTLRNLEESLKREIESVKKEHSEMKEKEAEAESVAGSLHVRLRKTKSELEEATAAEAKVRGASEELMSTLQQLSLECQNAKKEAEKMKKEADELKRDAEAARVALTETEKQLAVALREAEGAKASEVIALDQIKILSEKTNASRASTSELAAGITISKEENETLSRKVDESNCLAEMKVAAALAQAEAVRASENEALKRLEVMRKEIEETEAATAEALKRAEMAEAAKRAVEGELRRWREREQKKAANAASRILAETEYSVEGSPKKAKKMNLAATNTGSRKGVKTSGSKKSLLPNLSGIFHRRKSQFDGSSPSYLPGEKPV